MIDRIDLCVPTSNSADVLPAALDHAAAAFEATDADPGRLLVADGGSADGTLETARECAAEYGWDLDIVAEDCALPAAREQLAHAAETEWLWFLDDDVRVTKTYLAAQLDAIAPSVGAVQGRKIARSEAPTDWVRRRARRGGTHATLVRTAAVADATIPDDVTVLEDEWLRRWVESAGYVWTFNPHARFKHDCQQRHPIGYEEGVVAGRYGLKPFHEVALNVPFAAARARNPWPHVKRTAGWLVGALAGSRRDYVHRTMENSR